MQQDTSPQTNSAATNSSLTSGNNHVTVPVSVAINDVYTVLAIIQGIIDSVCDQNYDHSIKGRVYMPTFKYFFLAFLIVEGNNHQPGSIFKDVFKVYKRLCTFNNVHPLQLRSIESLYHQYTKARRISSPANHAERMTAPTLLGTICLKVIDKLNELTADGFLGDGEILRQALLKRGLKVNRILAIDGSVCRMADNAMEQAIKDGLDPKSCKGQTGTCSKKLHSILDVCSCSIPVFSLTGGTSSERQLIQEALNQGAFKEGDILLADGGYIDFELFNQLKAAGVHYVVKARSTANSEVISSCTYTFDTSTPLQEDTPALPELKLIERVDNHAEGTRLESIRSNAINTVIDAQVMLAGEVGRYVEVYNPHKQRNGEDYSPFVRIYTSLPLELITPHEVWLLSRTRWQIELAYKAKKQFCSMASWDTDRSARAEVLIAASLIVYLIKVAVAQAVQASSGKVLSLLSSCDVDEVTMMRYLGQYKTDFSEDLPCGLPKRKNSVKRRKAQERIENYKAFGEAVFVYEELLDTAVKARISRTNRRKFKGLIVVAQYFANSRQVVAA